MPAPLYTDPGQPGGLPSPPTGPEAEPYGRDNGSSSRFAAFIETGKGAAFMSRVASAALSGLSRGDRRFSVFSYIGQYRALHKVRITNNFAPLVADELVRRHPQLLDIIERRARKKAGAVNV